MIDLHNLFFSLKEGKGLEGFKIEQNYSKRVKDEFINLRLWEKSQDYDIQIMIWKKLFTQCHILQVSGHHGNHYFKVFFQLHDGHIKIFDFAHKDKCPQLYDNRHKFLDHLPENEHIRKRIYKDTKKLLKRFSIITTQYH